LRSRRARRSSVSLSALIGHSRVVAGARHATRHRTVALTPSRHRPATHLSGGGPSIPERTSVGARQLVGEAQRAQADTIVRAGLVLASPSAFESLCVVYGPGR
jgi:hypothetical protein